MKLRTYHDPLHGGIQLNKDIKEENMVMQLIDSSAFQRLRRIRQLGPAFLTFHGAESSRFTHSLGAFHIARKAFKQLIKIEPELEAYKGILYASSLLHDIGHGPLSHSSEEIFGIKHEEWSAKLIKENKEIRQTLEGFESGTSNQVAELLGQGNTQNKIIKSLISSQLDCDRLDYLLRDSYSTGTHYGQLDLERILSALTLAADGCLAISPQGLMAVEHYLVVRNLMYRSVYNHRVNEISNWILEQIIRIARLLGPKEVWADSCMKIWLWSPQEINTNSFLSNDDIRTSYHFLRWREEGPQALSELCERFINRNLLQALNINTLNNEEQLQALVLARKLTEKLGLNAELTCGLRHQKTHGYHPYRSGLRLWDGTNLKALEEASPLVQSLTYPSRASWLIHPKPIHEEFKQKLDQLINSNSQQTNKHEHGKE